MFHGRRLVVGKEGFAGSQKGAIRVLGKQLPQSGAPHSASLPLLVSWRPQIATTRESFPTPFYFRESQLQMAPFSS